MDPKITGIWKDALDRLSKAEQHLKMGKSDLAKNEAQNAATSGQIAITLLLRGKENDREAAEVGTDAEFFEDWEKTCSRPQDYITKAQKLLKRFSNLSPPENKLPLE
ncbi:hypothetical protein ACFL1G_11095 [Planctomycetota bacterium]